MTVQNPKPLAALLIERGLLTAPQMAQAQAEAARSGLSLRRVLVQRQWVPEPALTQLIADQAGLVHVDLSTQHIRLDVLALLDAELARQHAVLPLFRIENTLTVAVADPLNVFLTDELRLRTQCDIKRVVAGEADIQRAIERWYGPAKGGPLPPGPAAGRALAPLEALLHDAVARRVQTLWLTPAAGGLRVRWRIDGVVHDGPRVSEADQAAVLMRLKVLGHLDILQRQQAQAGQGSCQIDGHALTLRLHIMPGMAGESVTMHLHDTARPGPSLEELGLAPALQEEALQALASNPGLLLISAPQDHVLEQGLAAWAAAAQARGIPVMIHCQAAGQPDTAVLAAAVTDAAQQRVLCGFLVPPAAVPPHATVHGYVAVRSVRRLCRLCAVPYVPPPALAQRLGMAEQVRLFRAQGCPMCQGLGFEGECGVSCWSRQAPTPAAVAAHLRAAVEAHVRAGVTSWEEGQRVLEIT